MTVWLLVVLIFVQGQPTVVADVYTSKAECQDKEAKAATLADSDENVSGWSTLRGCESVLEPSKG